MTPMKSFPIRPVLLLFVLLIFAATQITFPIAAACETAARNNASAPEWEDVIERAEASLRRDPRSIDALRMLGEAHLALGDTLSAVQYLQRALSMQPHDAACLVMMVESLLALGKVDEADRYISAAEAKDNQGKIWEIKASRASLLAVQGRVPEALRILSEASAKNPQNPLYPKLLARLYRDRDIFELSVDYYRRAIALDEDNPLLRYELAQVLLKDKQFEEAMAEFKAVLERDPSNLEVNYQIGKLYFAAGRFDEALQPLQAATRDRPEHFLSHYLLGQTLNRLGRLQEAEASLRKSMELRPQRKDIQELLVKILAEEKKYGEEIELLNLMMSGGGADPDLLAMEGEAYYMLASLNNDEAAKSRHQDSALVYYKRSLAAFPDQPRITYRVATILYNSDEFDSAAVYYWKTMKLQPENCGAMINMGYSYGRLAKWSEAIHALRMGAECDKNNKAALSYLASILAARDSLNAAVEVYQNVIALDPEDCEAYGQTGLIYFNKEQYAQAIRSLYKAVTYCPARGDYWKLYGYANWSHFLKIRENIRDSHDGLIPGDELLEKGGSYLEAAEKGFDRALRYEPNDNDLKETLKAVTDYLNRLTGR